ncbi:DUF4232 domain-containing protein [Agromyces sp. NPDC058064]|uniref:DUF4232 domain-containing protein n=1 Tax=Agromyces sp. NPDC058064 TaxID=3346322 RepID=UPI0036DAD62F
MTRAGATATATTAALLLALALGGCAAGSATPDGSQATTDASPSASPTASSEPEATAVPDAGATPAGGGAAGDGTVAPRDEEPFADDAVGGAGLACDDAQFELAVTPLPDESGAGSFGFELVFTNTGAQACVFDGWPGLIAIDDEGVEVGWPAQIEAAATTPVVIDANGGVARAHVRASQAGAYGCTPIEASGVRARLASDGAGEGIDTPYAITVCDGAIATMRISPLVAG